MEILVHNKVVQVKCFNNGKKINTNSWPQFLMEAGLRHHASEERNSEEDRHPHLQGGDRAENRECDIKGPVRKEVRFISYSRTGISYKGEHIICYTWDLDLPLHLNINKL